ELKVPIGHRHDRVGRADVNRVGFQEHALLGMADRAASASDLSPLALSKEGSRAVMRINAARGSQARLHDGGRAMRAGRLRSRRQTGRESPPGPDYRSERLDQDGRAAR